MALSKKSAKAQKVVVITGATSGIGFSTVQKLLEVPHYKVILLGRGEEKLKNTMKALGGDSAGSERLQAVECDLANAKSIQKAADKILATHKSIYALINNAGIYPFGGLTDTSEESWTHTLDVNLMGPMRLIRALRPGLAKQTDGARVVNVSSTAGLLPNHFALAYSVSKAALIQLSKTLAKELGKDGISVNCVCPGIVKTPMHEGYHRNRSELESFYAKRGAAFPLGRVGEPEDVAGIIRFYLSPECSWVTGDVFVVDGGRLLI